MLDWPAVAFEIVRGRGAASGRREYQDIKGSIRAQKPHFLARGLDLSSFYEGTINAKLAVARFEITRPVFSMRDIRWLDGFPGENFDFCSCAIIVGEEIAAGLIYYPRPETKLAFTVPAPPDVVEILAPRLRGVKYGARGRLIVDPAQMRVIGCRS